MKTTYKTPKEKEVKTMKTTYKMPKDMAEAQEVCKRICAAFCVSITFDDKYKNFGNNYNKCVCHTSIECAKFDTWNYDLLPFAVLHELGHMKDTSDNSKSNAFTKELAAWKWAIDKYVLIFKQNIGIKQARYMMQCLNSYLPDYNAFSYDKTNKHWFDEEKGRFWCPIKKHVMQ